MRYPITKLPSAIEMVINYELCTRRRYRKPTTIQVETAETFAYYCKGINNKTGFVIDVDLKLKKGPPDPVLNNRLQTVKGNEVANYFIQWGSVSGDLAVGSGLVNVDKTKKPIHPGTAIIKGYIDRFDVNDVTITAYLHPKNAVPVIPEIKLSDRERRIMFVFAKLNGTEQAMALARLNATYDEIAALLKKQAISHSRGGYKITTIGLAAESLKPEVDRW